MPPAVAETFSSLVKRFREQRGLSQAALAKAAGVSDGYIGMIETGERGQKPGRDTVLGIAQGLRLSERERNQLLAAASRPGPGSGRGPNTEQAIQADPVLRSDQKRALIGIYRALIGER